MDPVLSIRIGSLAHGISQDGQNSIETRHSLIKQAIVVARHRYNDHHVFEVALRFMRSSSRRHKLSILAQLAHRVWLTIGGASSGICAIPPPGNGGRRIRTVIEDAALRRGPCYSLAAVAGQMPSRAMVNIRNRGLHTAPSQLCLMQPRRHPRHPPPPGSANPQELRQIGGRRFRKPFIIRTP